MGRLFKREKKSAGTMSGDGGNVGSTLPILQNLGSWNSMERQGREGYGSNPYVKRAVDLIAGAVSAVPSLLYDKSGKEIEDMNHPLLRLSRKPNPRQSWSAFVDETVHNLMIFGNAYIYIVSTIKGVDALWPINARNVQAISANDIFAPVSRYTVNTGQTTLNIMPSNMIHLKMYNPSDDLLGLSPVAAAGRMIEMQNSIMDWNISMAHNGCKPSLIIKVPDRMNSDQFQKFLEQFRTAYGGSDNTGLGMVLDGGKDIASAGFTSQEMDFINGITMTGRGIAMALMTPPELLGDSASKTYANAQEANKEFAKHTILPIIEMLYDELNRRITPKYDDVGVWTYDVEAIEDLSNDSGNLIYPLNAAEFLTVNEKREKMGYDDLGKDGDIIFMSMGKIPLDQVAEGYGVGLPMEGFDDDPNNE